MEIYRVSIMNVQVPMPITLFTWLQVQSQKSDIPFEVYAIGFFAAVMDAMQIPVVPAKAEQMQ